MLKRGAILCAAVLISAAVHAQRLPGVAIPQHYTLQLTPNLQTATFTGEETIDLTLAQATDVIVLNAWQLKFDAVTAEVNNPFGYARQLVRTDGKVRTAFFFPHDTEAAPWWQGENARLASMAAAARMFFS